VSLRAVVNGLGLLALLCLPPSSSIGAAAADLTKVRLATASGLASPITANILIPEFLGYYRQEGLDLDLASRGVTGGGAIIQALASGDAQIGTLGGVSLFALDQQSQDVELVAFYCYTRKAPERIGVSAESAIQTVLDLRGKKIGVRDARRSPYSEGILTSGGLSPDLVHFVPVGIGSTPMVALQRHEVDALSMSDVDLKRVELLGMKLRYLPIGEEFRKLQGPLLVATRQELTRDPKLLVGFARAVAKGTLFMLNNPEGAARIFYAMFPQAVPKGQNFEDVIAATTEMLKTRSPLLAIHGTEKWGEIEPQAWSTELKFSHLDGKLHKPLENFYTNQLIAEINQFDPAAIIADAKEFNLDKRRNAP
jgi:NitT/TauT family transport system substrate-binding protein